MTPTLRGYSFAMLLESRLAGRDMISAEQAILLVFISAFALILSEKLHRTIAAWIGCVIILFIGKFTGVFDLAEGILLEEAMLSWVDFEVIGLLLGMMVFAAVLEFCGFFEYVAIKAVKLSKGDPWMLVVYLGSFTTLLSLFIDNVTAIIIIAPVTLKMCQKLEINPIPPLLAEAILSDTGGVASMVGDPPNVMIAAKAHDLGLVGFDFNGFLFHLGLITLIAWGATLGYMRWYYRDWMKSKPAHVEEILEQDEWDSVDDPHMMKLTIAVLFLTVSAFSLHGVLSDMFHFELGIHAISLSGAGLILTLARPKEEKLRDGFLNDVIDKVEWQALLFFAGLFILVGAIGHVGYLTRVSGFVYNIAGGSELWLAVTVIWVAACASAIVDNIPFTAAMIPVIINMGIEYDVNTTPLFWALAMGAGFGGNATPIGSSANVMTVAISERGTHPITAREWVKVGLPVMLITCTIASLFMILFYEVLYV